MKKFELTITETDPGIINTVGNNNGFNALELLGLLELKKQDVINQINKPGMFKHTRTVIDGDEKETIEEVSTDEN